MKVLGLNCGSPGGNSELLLQASLMATEAAGHEVQLVRVATLAIPAGRPGTLPPEVPDDRAWLTEQLVESDALIISSPVTSRSPSAALKLMVDRAFGPRVDVAAVLRMKAGKQGDDPRYNTTIIDDRVLKPRVAGLISVGGATSPDWLTFGLPLMHMATFSMHIAVVDQVQFMGAALPGTILFDEAAMDRAAAVGRHVAAEIGKSFDEAAYHGEPGVCPVCHCDVIVPHADHTECATCAARGELVIEGGRPRLLVTPDGRARSILTLAAKHHHQDEIDAVSAASLPRMSEVPALRARFDAYDRLIAPERNAP
ncbi:flavodoxin family protein [Sphingomonas sp.]|jgi:multimeric flavodoxin WrbA|uniref:flavodoxin family protein n=1 Tax=Sphingomonas sp. TaxID=28214 RepID=UPI002D7E6F75|nr:NAD(P)H-dependent oxidoreductase [Sphingomonas sp.]HEU0044483.1 NAD(P)H-dependent oxidoreductase [Sphingomonas sp.]